VGKRTSFGLVLTTTVCAALSASGYAAGAQTPAQPPASPPPTEYTHATAGIVGPAPAAVLSGQTTVAAPARPRGARRIPAAAAPAATADVRAPAAAASPPSARPLTSLLSNFNGVSSHDSAITNFGHQFEPPDQGLCTGNGFVLEMVNSAYTVYDTTGKTLAGPFNINGPFNEGLTEFTSDPRCYYDATHNTWFATILALNPQETASTLDIAVNASGDPRKQWTVYKIDTTAVGGKSGTRDPGCPCFGDQPTLGVDAVNLYVTTNEFSIKGPQFNGAQVYAFAKKDLVSLSSSVHFVHFSKLAIGGAPAASVQPALTSGGSPAEYFLNSLDPTGTFDSRIGVWALTNRAAVGKGEVPTLSSVVIPSEAYGLPPEGEQKGSSTPIASNDDRMQQTQYAGGSVWGELTTALTLPGDPVQRAGGAWFQVKPVLSSGALSTAKMQRQGYVGVPGNSVLFPALQVTSNGHAAMVATLTGATRHPSAAYSVLLPEAGAFGPVTVAAAGAGTYEGERWGDYSFAALDPSGASVWLATEYVPPKSSQTPDGVRNWGTRVLDVVP
jgi:hypothetical protein